MAFVTWDEKFSVGIEEVDAQHRELVHLISELHAHLVSGSQKEVLGATLDDILGHVAVHFQTEETLMVESGFPGYEEQRGVHAAFVKQISDFRTGFEEDRLALTLQVMNYLKEWVTGHILREDKPLGDHLAAT